MITAFGRVGGGPPPTPAEPPFFAWPMQNCFLRLCYTMRPEEGLMYLYKYGRDVWPGSCIG